MAMLNNQRVKDVQSRILYYFYHDFRWKFANGKLETWPKDQPGTYPFIAGWFSHGILQPVRSAEAIITRSSNW
jgi:hypothetical protein